MGAGERILAGAAMASGRVPELLSRSSRGLLNGLWLGALGPGSLAALDERRHDADGIYVTEEWNAQGLFGWESDLTATWLDGRARLLVPGCGGGREVLALLEAGHDVQGYEPHAGLAEYAERFLSARGYPGRVHPMPRDELPEDAPPADGVLVGWGTLSLIHGRERRNAFLRSLRERLPGGAPVLLSFFARASDTRELRVTRAVANGLRGLRGRPRVELGDTLAPNLAHVFSPAEVKAELAEAGFELAELRKLGAAADATDYACAVGRRV